MIIGGGKRANWRKFAPHLMKTENGQQQVRVVEIRGLAADNVTDAFHELEALGKGTRAKNFYYHANIDPRADEHMTEEQWEYAVDLLEKNLGLEGQERFIVEHYHEDDGRTHRHVVWSRVTDDLKVVPNDFDRAIHQGTADQLEQEFGHEKTPRTRDKGKPKGPDNWEYFRGKESRINPKEVQAELTALWHQADTGHALAAAIADRGYILAEGNRGLCIVDQAGHEHSLARRAGVRVKDVEARMADIDRGELPTVAEARKMAKERAKGKDRDDAPPQSDHHKRDAALEVAAEEIAEAVHDALKSKGKERPQDEQSPPKAEAARSQATEPPSPDPEPPQENSSAAPPPSDPSPVPEPSAGAREASARPTPPYTRPAPAPEPVAAPQPSLFERLAQKLTDALHTLGGGLTVAEAAELSAPRALPSHEGVPLAPWEILPPDRIAPASTATPFERIAQELARDARQAAPVLETLAVVAATVAEHQPPSEFERLAQELTHDAAPPARELASGPEPDPFARVVRDRQEALRESGGEGLFIAEGIDWRARQAGTPYMPEHPPEGELSAFERVVWEKQSATRDNGGEPVTHDGRSFWGRAIALIRSAREHVTEWVKDTAKDFVGRLLHQRNAERSDNERER